MEDKTDEKVGMDSILKMRKHVLVTQSCPALCDLRDLESIRLLQARILEWVTIPFRGFSQSRD